MKSYSKSDIIRVFKQLGVKTGDTVFFTARIAVVGRLADAHSADEFCRIYQQAIFEVIGPSGTLVMPTHTPQIGRFGLDYIHEETPTPSGILNEFLRKQPGAVRSFHPVFSLTAFGEKAAVICNAQSTSGFGVGSAYGNLFENGGVAVSLGFEPNSGHLVTGAHYLETTYGVPYYYNKILDASVYRDGKRLDKIFVLNVAYRSFAVEPDYGLYTETLRREGLLRQAVLGDAVMYASDLKDQLSIGYRLLAENVYAFLKRPPQFKAGVIPLEGWKMEGEGILSPAKDRLAGYGEWWIDADKQLQPV